MSEFNHYFLCDGTAQPATIQRAILSSLKTEIPEHDSEVADQLQQEVQTLNWEKFLFIVSPGAFLNPHWDSLGLVIEKTISDLNELDDIPLGCISLYEKRSDVPAQLKDQDPQSDIIMSIIKPDNTTSITVEQKYKKSPTSSLSRFKKILGKISGSDPKPKNQSTPRPPGPLSSRDRNAENSSERDPNELSSDDDSRYDNINYHTPIRQKVNFSSVVSQHSIPPREPVSKNSPSDSYMNHNLSCNTTRCHERKKTMMRLNAQIEIPSFDHEIDLVDLVIEKLRLITTDLQVDSEQVIYSFCYKNSLSDTHVGLSSAQRSNIDEFGKILKQRFGTTEAAAASRFNNIRMRSGEDESDLMSRICQISNLMKRKPINTVIDNADSYFLREKFISCLPDPTIRLLLRQMDVTPKDLVRRARELRLAKETEKRHENHLPSQIVALTQRVQELETDRLTCKFCGRNHHSDDCRDNAKGKANFNKTQNGQRKPKRYVHFDESGRQMSNPHQNTRRGHSHRYHQNRFRPRFQPNQNYFNDQSYHVPHGYLNQGHFGFRHPTQNAAFFTDQPFFNDINNPYPAFFSQRSNPNGSQNPNMDDS